MATDIHFEEFLYRGRPTGDARPPAWQVTLLENCGASAFDQRIIWKHHTLSMQQAEAAGWPLPDIIAAINADLLQECETLRLQNKSFREYMTEHGITLPVNT